MKLNRSKNWALIVGGTVIGAIILSAVIPKSEKQKLVAREKKVISLCWEEKKKNSTYPDLAKRMTETCELLEANLLYFDDEDIPISPESAHRVAELSAETRISRCWRAKEKVTPTSSQQEAEDCTFLERNFIDLYGRTPETSTAQSP